MDQVIAFEADPVIPLSFDAEVNKCLIKITEKLKQFKTIGLIKDDHQILEERLSYVWGDLEETDPHADDSAKLKAWRHARARGVYEGIQDANNLLFLAVVLVIPPSESVKKRFQKVVNYFGGINNYEPYRLNLNPENKMFFESTSVKQGFTGSHRYLRFMEAVFPQGKDRVIKYAYSYVPVKEIPAFLEAMAKGIYKSRLFTDEDTQKAKTSSCLSILIPNADQDGGCTLVVNRQVLMNAIYKFGLSELKLD